MNTISFIVLTSAILSAIPYSVNQVSAVIDPCFSLNSSSRCFPPEPNCISAPLWRCSFPRGFIFGTASSAYQYEGAHNIDGRGQSIWDTFTYEHPDKIEDHTTGEIAIDHYNRYKEDIALMKKTGLDAYRFSISWSRVLPNGKRSGCGVVNQKGLTFYNNLINEIIAQGMKPFATIFHWDLPQHLEFEYGGFLSKRIVQDFQDYAELLFETFGDRVKHWITLNEPSTYSTLGYDMGANAPGRCSKCTYGDSGTEPYIVTHHHLLAHAAAVDVYRKKFKAKQGGVIGISLCSLWMVPYNYSTYDDIAAAERALDFQLGWFMDPMTNGDYPKSMRDIVQERLPRFTPEEQETVKGSFDFIGLNYYTAYYAQDVAGNTNLAEPSYSTDWRVQLLTTKDGVPLGDMLPGSWICIYPRGLMRLLNYIKHKYGNHDIYITENGLSDSDDPSLPVEEALKDKRRELYYKCHLHSLLEAIDDHRVKVRGFFIWSFMDNLEWASGYKTRFGIVYVDHKKNLKRSMKDSAVWFSKFLRDRVCPVLMPDSVDLKEL